MIEEQQPTQKKLKIDTQQAPEATQEPEPEQHNTPEKIRRTIKARRRKNTDNFKDSETPQKMTIKYDILEEIYTKDWEMILENRDNTHRKRKRKIKRIKTLKAQKMTPQKLNDFQRFEYDQDALYPIKRSTRPARLPQKVKCLSKSLPDNGIEGRVLECNTLKQPRILRYFTRSPLTQSPAKSHSHFLPTNHNPKIKSKPKAKHPPPQPSNNCLITRYLSKPNPTFTPAVSPIPNHVPNNPAPGDSDDIDHS